MFLFLNNLFTITMDDEYNDALDWKKVFKKVLNGQGQSTENESSTFRESIQGPNSNSGFRPEDKNARKSISSTSVLVTSTSRNDYDSSKVNVCKSKSFNNLNVKNLSIHELNVNRLQAASSSTKQKCDFPGSSSKDGQVPEWNKVFKSILGSNSTVPEIQEQKNTHYAVKRQENVQKHDASVNARCTPRKKIQEVPKSKVDPEEEKVRELFALSRLFKLDYHNSINEFEGSGVDIFKCGKKTFPSSFMKNTVYNAESTDKSSEDDSESFVPLKGVVANLKPYTTADLLASPIIHCTEETWDDDLLI